MDDQISYARNELKLIGQMDSDPDLCQSILGAMAAFLAYEDHSGESHMAAVNQLCRLLNGKALCRPTDDPEEWMFIANDENGKIWQNRRTSSAFSRDHGKTYYDIDEDPEKTIPSLNREQMKLLSLMERTIAPKREG